MLRYRFVIPLVFGLLCLALGLYGKSRRDRTLLDSAETVFQTAGQSVEVGPVQMKKGMHYHLFMKPARGMPLFKNAAFGATLINTESGVEVFALEDYYWHQRGTWREGGESGTWEERNDNTNFAFKVPETGKYVAEIALIQTDMGAVPAQIAVQESNPFSLAEWPLFIGALLFMGIAVFVYMRRPKTAADILRNLGYGSKIRIEGKDFEVKRIYDYADPQAVAPGVEYELFSEDGMKRHVAVDVMEYWYEDSEGDDVVKRYHQILMDVPLNEVQTEALEQSYRRNRKAPKLGTTMYWRDEDNAGYGHMTDWRGGGKPAKIRYEAEVFRQRGGFPKQFGDKWLERVHYAGDQNDYEWALLRIVDWRELKVTKRTPRPKSSNA